MTDKGTVTKTKFGVMVYSEVSVVSSTFNGVPGVEPAASLEIL